MRDEPLNNIAKFEAESQRHSRRRQFDIAQAIPCYCTMKTDLKAELEWLSLAKLVAEFTRELSLQYLIPVDLSDGGKDYTRSLIVPSGIGT